MCIRDSCKTGLANEEVVNGCCERCGAPVTKKNLKQWMLKITAYADRLLDDLDKLDWPEKVKKMQTDWIGKSYGAEIDFQVDGKEESIKVYTCLLYTSVDLYGAGRGKNQFIDHPERCGLAAAAFTQKDHKFSVVDRKADVVNYSITLKSF